MTLTGLAAFQAKLGATGTLVPASRRDPQLPSLNRRQSERQIEIFEPRQLWFRESSFAEFSHHRLPHFLPRYGVGPVSAGVRGSSAESLAESSELAAIARTKMKTRTKTKTNRKPARIGRAITLVLCFLRLLSQATFPAG